MFTPMKNIDTAFRHIRLFSFIFIIACAAITCYVQYKTAMQLQKDRQTIYVLVNGEILKAYAAEKTDKLDVQLRHHVSDFHFYFFNLDPDEKMINDNITKALYLADASAKTQYDNLKANGYYTNIIAGNISQRIQIDSVALNINEKPYYFRCYAKEKLIRSTSIVTRSLVTAGYIRDNLYQTDNNRGGFLIERWTILENKDLSTETR